MDLGFVDRICRSIKLLSLNLNLFINLFIVPQSPCKTKEIDFLLKD